MWSAVDMVTLAGSTCDTDFQPNSTLRLFSNFDFIVTYQPAWLIL